jgi:hypothetical protein
MGGLVAEANGQPWVPEGARRVDCRTEQHSTPRMAHHLSEALARILR